MKKNKMMRTASALLVATLLTTSVISGTFAKYTSTATGTDTARVAKWSFTVGDTDIAKETTLSFDLFNTVKEANITADESHLKTTDGSIIAPGTGGSFEIKLKNASEVTAQYAINFSEENTADVPIEYSVDNATWEDNISNLNINASNDTVLSYDSTEKVITVYWRWVYETENDKDTRNASDTQLGTKESLDTVIVKAEITATQVD